MKKYWRINPKSKPIKDEVLINFTLNLSSYLEVLNPIKIPIEDAISKDMKTLSIVIGKL